jgi:hypothetical protein
MGTNSIPVGVCRISVDINLLINFPLQLQFDSLLSVNNPAPDRGPKDLAIFKPNHA